ncbi:hypothetical protein QN219_06430 [Sinorhizobium sp. 7-81]|uniref:hypothetical protein n=1 Tax=Sinorhizobium sp. 8-89 TaxID=3049089 RepID=UPI0024C36697|nr:hypothetical protein [Sinorhizobium sp. 8-89]MDK1489694.1 hypothetical protein [Sinorhizobium sp. 8-89]
MRDWLLGIFYLFLAALGLLVALDALVLATIDPYSYEDMSRGGICERSGDVAPECAMPPEDPNKVLDALLACDMGFFKILQEEKAAFRRAEIQPVPHNLFDPEEPRVTFVRFREPVEAYGLHLTGYLQQTDATGASWGFHATEEPAEVARAIEARRPGKEKFSEYGDSRRRIENSPGRTVVISPPGGRPLPGTSLYCQRAGETGAVEELPDGFDLFLSQGLATNFLRRLEAFVASAGKTLSDLAR